TGRELPPETAAVALAVIEHVEREDLAAAARKLGKVLQKGVVEMVETRGQWAMGSRGRGLVRGLTLWGDPRTLVAACRERGLAVGQAGESSIVFAPPLVASATELAETLRAVSAAMESGG